MNLVKIIKIKNGYTLIEVIIAAVIFAILITVTMVTFGSNSNLQARSEIVQSASQNAKFISEAIARDIRLADKVTIPTSPLGNCTTETIKKCKQIDIIYGDEIISYRFVKTGTNPGEIQYKDKDTKEEYVTLNAQNIILDEMYFINNDPEINIHIVFSTEGEKSKELFTQTIDTSVSTRNYPNFYDKFTPQL